jgi:PDZ domain-containing protein
VLLRVAGKPVTDAAMLVRTIRAGTPGEPIPFVVVRDGKQRTVEVTPRREDDGVLRVGFTPGQGFTYPFDVSVNIDPNIGGPSAGIIFSLGIYDTLTPGSLTGGRTVAGTGTIDLDGAVGPIGGIQQKIAGAEQDGAVLFLVPPDDCAEALEVDDGSPLLVRADSFSSAVDSLEKWVKDPDADLPTCEDTE